MAKGVILTFGQEELGEVIKDFQGKDFYVVYAALKTLVYGFINLVAKELSKPNSYPGLKKITDMMKVDERPSPSYMLVFDRKLVLLTLTEADIDVCDEDEVIYAVRSLSIQAANQKTGEQFLSCWIRFLKQQDLKKIIALTAHWLKKEEISHLNLWVHSFYGL